MSGTGLKIGFTGTREGMTKAQRETLRSLLTDLRATEAHHGMCVGADAEFGTIVAAVIQEAAIHGHPSSNKALLATCDVDVLHPERAPLARNRDIVDAVNLLFAAPKGPEELRSGTWSTIRYARRQKHCSVTIIAPNGRWSIGVMAEAA